MKILAVIPGKKDGTEMIFCKEQISALKKNGINIHSFYLSSRTNLLLIIKELIRFKKIIRKYQPDIIHAHFGTMTSFFCATTSLKPLIITFRGNDLNPIPNMNFLRDFFGKFLSQISILRAKKIICVSLELKNRMWWKKNKAVILPSGVNTKIFYPQSQKYVRKILNLNNINKIIIFNASHKKQEKLKRLDIAKDVYNKVKEKVPNLKIIILRGKTLHNKIPIYLNAADCLLLTSDCEGSPNIVKEAMACNLPVVSFDVGDVKERLKKIYPSKVVDKNIDEMTAAVIKILKSNERSNGFKNIMTISNETLIIKIIKLYRNLIE